MNLKLVLNGLFSLIFLFLLTSAHADKNKRFQSRIQKASTAFCLKSSEGTPYKFKFDTVTFSIEKKEITLKMNPVFSYIPFRKENSEQYYDWYKEILGKKFRKYSLSIESMGKEITELIPNYYRGKDIPVDQTRLNQTNANVVPLVRNISKSLTPEKGLSNRNIALWHSHGWYYENTLDRWEWQRARVFLTVEDIWTMSFVVPYLVPMLENAGAQVFLPRERDIQTNEIIIDADGSSKNSDYNESGTIIRATEPGFGMKFPFLLEGDNPFRMGETRKMKSESIATAEIEYVPEIPETGEYAVYVSYSRSNENVKDAQYSVWHSGGVTHFQINQTMGGSTWIYLGTFGFEKGKNPHNGKLRITNQSTESGKWISVDAVKFGGGVGNIARGKLQDLEYLQKMRNENGFKLDSSVWIPFTSQRPRYQEGSRYYLQYAGMPDTLVYLLNKTKIDYSNRGNDAALYALRESGKDDYKDDYQSRGEWVNYLMGSPNGPTANPKVPGLNIPVDMAMAFHTDAGITPDSAIIGCLMIYDTTFGPGEFPNGQSRWVSRDLTDIIQTQVVDDLQKLYYKEWTRRGMWNKPYSEAFRPKVPTVLSELLSHQNFADMHLAHDPRFKFDVCRAYYKGILKFLAFQNQQELIVQPLPVSHFGMKKEGNHLKLSWKPVSDLLEPSSIPDSYRLYTRTGNRGFDNGKEIKDSSFLLDSLVPGEIYSFKITAINKGGESFPSEILSCCLPADDKKPVLIVNAFDRICGPAAFDNGKEAGFRMDEDEGVAWKNNICYIGEQYDFSRKSSWKDDDASGFGSSHADQETRIVPGNSFDYPFVHGKAFRNNGFGFLSVSDEFFELQNWNSKDFSALDIIFGEEKTTSNLFGYKKKDFTIYTPEMRSAILKFLSTDNAKILISGAYIGTDIELCGDTLAKKFAAETLHYTFRTNHASKSGCVYPANAVKPAFTKEINFVQDFHPSIYKVEAPDAIEPKGENAKVLFRYKGDNKTAGVCYDGKYQTLILGFPIETISTSEERNEFINEILKYWKLIK